MNFPDARMSEPAEEIVLVVPDFSGGGAERAAINLAGALSARGARVNFLVERVEGELADEAAARAPIEIISGKSLFAKIDALRKHMRAKNNADFISFMTRSNIMCSLARRFLRRKPLLVLTEHNNRKILLARMTPVRRALSYAMLFFSFHGADRIVCVSDGILNITRRLFFIRGAKLTRIYNPIVTHAMICRKERAAPTAADHAEALIVSAGRLHPQKDFQTLLRAGAILRKHGPFRMKIYGEGPERDRLEQLADRLGLRGVVSFPGFQKDLSSALAAADLFVLSSRWEGFGNVIAEALACGAPVVSTDCESGPREILAEGKFGRLTPVGDARALARAMRDSLLAPNVAPPAAAFRFTAQTAAEQYLALIHAIKNPQPV